MLKKNFLGGLLFFGFLFTFSNIGFTHASNETNDSKKENFVVKPHAVYNHLANNVIGSIPSREVFNIALRGFNNLRLKNSKIEKNIITVIDFSLPSTARRLWVIDLANKKILFNDYVAHGRNSGANMAKKFSNIPSSNTSSLGFYITAETYYGKHGLSLRLDGMESGFNDNARKRAIVMHGADYVSRNFIEKHGRLGRSFGCPALPMNSYKEVIETIHGGSALFIYSLNDEYFENSNVLNNPGQ